MEKLLMLSIKLLIGMSILADCSEINLDEKIACSFSIWSDKNLRNYEYEIKWDYFYMDPLRHGPFFVRVLNGRVDSVWYNFDEAFVEKGMIIPDSIYSEFHIDSIFSTIMEKRKIEHKSFEVVFNDSLGYPVKYKIVYKGGTAQNHPEWFFLRGFKYLDE